MHVHATANLYVVRTYESYFVVVRGEEWSSYVLEGVDNDDNNSNQCINNYLYWPGDLLTFSPNYKDPTSTDKMTILFYVDNRVVKYLYRNPLAYYL